MPALSSLFSRSFLVLILILLGFSSAQAGVREASDSILDSRAHRVLTTIADDLGTEDTVLPKGHAVAILSLGGCNLNLMVVGPVEGDARAYARVVDAWRERQGFKGDVRWSQEDDCAAAKYAYAPGHLGAKTATTTIDLPLLRTALLSVEPHTQFVVADAVWSKVDLGFAPDAATAQGTRYWNLTSPRPGLRPVSGTIVVSDWVPWVLGAWFLVPILGVLGGFAAGVAIARNGRVPLARRRFLYGKAVLGGTYTALGVHGLLVAVTLPTRVFDPLAQLWFGQRFTQLALPIVPAFALIPILALPFVNRVEKRLMGPSDEERLRQEPEVVPKRPMKPMKPMRFGRLRGAFFGIGLAIVAVGFFLPKTVHFREMLNPLGMMVAFLPGIFLQRRGDLPKYIVDPETLERLGAMLKEHVARMATRLDIPAPSSRVLTEAIYGRFGAVLDKKGVGVTIGALEALAPEEIDFLVAHELAHAKLGHLKHRKRFMVATMAVAMIPLVVVVLGGHILFATPALIFTPMLVPIMLMVPLGVYSRRRMRRQEMEADALAVHATGNPAAAAIALRKITLNSVQPGIHDMDMASHPAVNDRLAAIGA